MDSISLLSSEALIVLKAKAWLDLSERKTAGEKIDSKDIKKHKNDIFRLFASLPGNVTVMLTPGIESDVRQFLKEIEGMATQDITDVVNRWVKDKRISDYGNSRKGVLWGILHDAGLYLKSKTNWNGRVK